MRVLRFMVPEVDGEPTNPGTLEQARAAKPHAVEVFRRFGDLAGVGITRVRGGYGLKVNLARAGTGNQALPSQIDGVPVVVEIVGTVRAR